MPAQLLQISPTDTISLTPSQISSDLGDEAVILHLDSGVYYGLNEVGARIWELLQERSRRFSDIQSIVLSEYDVSPEVFQQDLTNILHELRGAGLVEVQDEKS